MIRDITIGQHFPGNSVVHTLDPRIKLVLSVLGVVTVFLVKSQVGMLLTVILTFALYMLAKIKLRIIFKSLKSVFPLLAFMLLFNIFFYGGETVLFSYGVIRITKEALQSSLFLIVRLVCVIALTSLITYTTSPIVLSDAIESLLTPLSVLHFPVHDLAMMMSLALRFIPTLIDETDRIMNAQKARGADTDSGGLLKRVKAFIPILIPLLLSSLNRADDLATAMDCRCYNSQKNRTKLSPLVLHSRDILGFAVVIAVMVCLVMTNYLPLPEL